MRIAVTGCRLYEDKRKVREFLSKLKSDYGTDIDILSGGSKSGIDTYAKKFSLDFGFRYIEYNPFFTVHNLYSRFSKEYYSKPYHVSQFQKRKEIMISECDYLACFIYNNSPIKNIEGLLKSAKKNEIPYVLIN